jgi:hypothetical protein
MHSQELRVASGLPQPASRASPGPSAFLHPPVESPDRGLGVLP